MLILTAYLVVLVRFRVALAPVLSIWEHICPMQVNSIKHSLNGMNAAIW